MDQAERVVRVSQPDRGLSQSPPAIAEPTNVSLVAQTAADVHDTDELVKLLQQWCIESRVTFIGSAVRDETVVSRKEPR